MHGMTVSKIVEEFKSLKIFENFSQKMRGVVGNVVHMHRHDWDFVQKSGNKSVYRCMMCASMATGSI